MDMARIEARLVGMAVAAAAVACGGLRAEQDYEFVKALAEEMKYEDLAARMVARLERSQDKALQLEGLLAKAALRKAEAAKALSAEQPKLLDEVKSLYEKFLQDGAAQSHRLYAIAQSDAATIDMDVGNAKLKAAADEKDPAKAQSLRREAAQMFSRVSAQLLASVKAQEPALEALLKEVEKETEKGLDALPPALQSKVDRMIGAFYQADAKYCQGVIAEIRALPEGDAARKDKAKELDKYIQKRTEQLAEYGIVLQRYYFFLAQAYMEAGDFKKADEYFQGALDAVDMEEMPASVKKTVSQVMQAIAIEKVKMKNKLKDYKGLVNDVRRILRVDMPELADQPIGKELALEMAMALAKLEDYEAACKEAYAVVQKGGPWANNARRALANILEMCPAKERRKLVLPPDLWFEAANGYYSLGSEAHAKYKTVEDKDKAQAEALMTEARRQLGFAVEYFRRTITLARAKGTPLHVRLRVEPQCWARMGLAFYKLGATHEAVIACMAGIENFNDANVLAMIRSDPKLGPKAAGIALAKDPLTGQEKFTEDIIKKLTNALPPTYGKGLFAELASNYEQCRNNARIAVAENKRRNPSQFNGWLYVEVMGKVDPAQGKSASAKLKMTEAGNLMETAQEFKKQGKEDLAAKTYLDVKKLYEEAIAEFGQVGTNEPDYEEAMFLRSVCAYMLFSLAQSDRLGFKKEEKPAKLKEYADKASGFFDKFEEAAKNPRVDEAGRERRRINMGRTKFYRALMAYGLGEYDKAFAFTDQYIEHEKAYPPPPDQKGNQRGRLLYEKVKAKLEITAAKPPKEALAIAGEIEAMTDEFKDDPRRHKYVQQMLAARYMEITQKAQAEPQPDEALVNAADLKAAEWQEKVLLLKERDGDRLTLDEMGALAERYRRTGNYEKAMEMLAKAIEIYDPDGDNRILPDVTWAQYNQKFKAIIRLNDFDKTNRCKQDHEIMLDLLYHDPSRYKQDPKVRPAGDRYDRDYVKARKKIEEIRKEYPECQTNRPEFGPEPGKSYLQKILDEIDFRVKILTVRDVLSEVALELAAQAKKKDDKETFRKYADIAQKQIELLLNEYGNVPEMELKRAEILQAMGEYQRAIEIYWSIKKDCPQDSDLFPRVSKAISKCYFDQGNFREAVAYPHHLLVTVGLESAYIKKHWPDIEVFLKKCYDAGAPKLEIVKTAAAPKLLYRPKTRAEEDYEPFEQLFRMYYNTPKEKEMLLPVWWVNFADKAWAVLQDYKTFPEKEKVLTKKFLEGARIAQERAIESWKALAKTDKEKAAAEEKTKALKERIGEITRLEREPAGGRQEDPGAKDGGNAPPDVPAKAEEEKGGANGGAAPAGAASKKGQEPAKADAKTGGN